MTSKLTSKFQTTIPLKIRQVLGLRQGDSVAFEIQGESVVLRKAVGTDAEYLKALEPTLNEWSTENDERAYKNL